MTLDIDTTLPVPVKDAWAKTLEQRPELAARIKRLQQSNIIDIEPAITELKKLKQS